MTGHETPVVTDALARANDTGSGGFRAGLTFPGFFALLAQAYLDHYGVAPDALADVSVKNRANGARNPHAQFQSEVSREQVLASRMIASPLRLFECSPISDGASAVVVASLEWAQAHADGAVEIVACEQASGPTTAEQLESFTSFPAAVRAGEAAFGRAGVTPADIDVAEVHDCFAIAEWLALEDLGFVERGAAPAETAAGATRPDGRIPVNTSGGLLSKGHPIGATGLAQIIEIARQLRGEADNQVDLPELGLAHNIGGTGGVASITILAPAR
jgi:acetyl-CoA C-acetyltransferase